MDNKFKYHYSPEAIASATHLVMSYDELSILVKSGRSIKDLKYIDYDLKMQFIKFSKEEFIKFDSEVRKEIERKEMRVQLQTLRNKISNAKLRILEIQHRLGEGG